jgi:tetratricopeptide (TPR) repeat protein
VFDQMLERLRRAWQEGLDHNQKREAWPTIQRGRELFAQGPQEKAQRFLSDAAQRFPDNAEIRMLYGSSLLAVRPEDGIREVMTAIQLDPEEPNRLARAASIMFSMARFDEAREYASRARRLGGADFLFSAELTCLEADFALRDGDEDAAEMGYRRAIELEPGNERSAIQLAKFLMERGRSREAVEVVESALQTAKDTDRLIRMRRDLVDDES